MFVAVGDSYISRERRSLGGQHQTERPRAVDDSVPARTPIKVVEILFLIPLTASSEVSVGDGLKAKTLACSGRDRRILRPATESSSPAWTSPTMVQARHVGQAAALEDFATEHQARGLVF